MKDNSGKHLKMKRKKIFFTHPDLTVTDLAKSFNMKLDNSITEYFSGLTGKKYIIETYSCRSALYLAYSVIEKGEIITTPLTCHEALFPIVYTEKTPIYADVEKKTLNFSAEKVERLITKKTKAIQAIHFGGNPCNLDELVNLATKKSLLLIEDCAQSLGSFYKGKSVGSFGDIACFSLSKNMDGIGGIFATNNLEVYKKALSHQDKFNDLSKSLVLYKLIRIILYTKRKYFLFDYLLRLLMKTRGNYLAGNIVGKISFEKNYCRKLPSIFKKINQYQLKKINNTLLKSANIANLYNTVFMNTVNLNFQQNKNTITNGYCRYYIYSGKFNKDTADTLNKIDIEVKHLKQEFGKYYQHKIKPDSAIYHKSLDNCKEYQDIHDKIIALPLHKFLRQKDISKIYETITNQITLT